MNTVTLFRPCSQGEFDLVKASGFKAWPPRRPDQDIFYPVENERYAHEVNRWNLTQFGNGYVLKFEVEQAFMDQFELKCVGAKHHVEWWIPAARLAELNKCIVGTMEVIYANDGKDIKKRD